MIFFIQTNFSKLCKLTSILIHNQMLMNSFLISASCFWAWLINCCLHLTSTKSVPEGDIWRCANDLLFWRPGGVLAGKASKSPNKQYSSACDIAFQIRKVVAPRITTCQPADFCYTKLNFMPPPIFMIEPFVFCRIMTSSPESAFQLSFLYSRSPKARDRLRLPLTRYWLGLDCNAEQQLV